MIFSLDSNEGGHELVKNRLRINMKLNAMTISKWLYIMLVYCIGLFELVFRPVNSYLCVKKCHLIVFHYHHFVQHTLTEQFYRTAKIIPGSFLEV